MDDIDYCEERSQELLNSMKLVVDELHQQFSKLHDTSDEDNFEVKQINSSLKKKQCNIQDTSDDKIPYISGINMDRTSCLPNALSPKEVSFKKELTNDEYDSLTSKKGMPVAYPRKTRSIHDHFPTSEPVWSVESGPTPLVPTNESSVMDFHQVEAVLPRRRRNRTDDDDHEVDGTSDGTQSHTVYNIAKLVNELNAEKKKNDMLEGKLYNLQSELAAAKAELDLEKVKAKEHSAGHLSALIEEIYSAQKERESAMMARLKLAVQERDEALLRAKAASRDVRLNKQNLNNNTMQLHDTSLHELLNAALNAEGGRAVDNISRDVISYVTNLKNERMRITAEEMRTVIRERDQAVQECRILANEITKYKRSLPVKQTNCDILDAVKLQADLQSAINERDIALSKLSSLEEEMETMQVCYSLQKSISKQTCHVLNEEVESDAQRLAEALRIANDHSHVQDANAKRMELEMKRLNDKNNKLERLVKVLRKKLSSVAEKSIHDSSIKSRS